MPWRAHSWPTPTSESASRGSREPDWIERAEEQLRRAQALDPLLAEVHLVRNWILCSGYGAFKMEEAIRELELAKQLNPSVGRS